MKKLTVLILLLLVFGKVFSQSPVFLDEAQKYWYYRDRLKYFVMPGSAPGQSILFSIRNPTCTQWDGTTQTIQAVQPRMMMGFYIGMLATEYKLLKDNGQYNDATNTLNELNLALDALIRMDKCEDEIPWVYNYESMDGFFIREDIPPVLSDEMEAYFNQGIDASLSAQQMAQLFPGRPSVINKFNVRCTRQFEDPQNYFYSNNLDFTHWAYENDEQAYWQYWKGYKFISQDELIGMLMGLALVVKCVDDQPTKNKAIDIGGKTVSFTLGNNALTNSEYASVIEDATGVNGEIVFTGMSQVDLLLTLLSKQELGRTWMRFPDNTLISDACGGNTYTLSKGIIYSGRFITSGCANAYPEVYQSLSGTQKAIWQLALNTLESNISNQNGRNNMAMMSRLLAISNLSDYRTQKHLGNYNKWDVFYLMMRAVLHDGDLRDKNFFNYGRLIDQLQTAPCGGPYKYYFHPSGPNSYPNGWATYLKYQTDVESQNGGYNHYGNPSGYDERDVGIFSGIDYMLFYNLACLAFSDGFYEGGVYYTFPYYINLDNRSILNSYYPDLSIQDHVFQTPGGNGGPITHHNYSAYVSGSISSPEEIRAISTITTDMVVGSGYLVPSTVPSSLTLPSNEAGDVTLTAGESIRLADGFRVEAGAHFLARIESYSCGGVSYKNMEAPPWDENYRGCFYDTLVSIPMDKRAPIVYSEDDHSVDDFDTPLWDDYYYTYDTTSNPGLEVGVWLNPNPCQNSGTLTLVSENDTYITIELFDMGGQKRATVFEGQSGNSSFDINIDMSTYAKGIYMLRITGDNGFKVMKFVKE